MKSPFRIATDKDLGRTRRVSDYAPAKFEISFTDFKDQDDAGRSYDLYTEGETLEECLERACYFMIDQDGGCLGDCPADDDAAVEYIIEKWGER